MNNLFDKLYDVALFEDPDKELHLLIKKDAAKSIVKVLGAAQMVLEDYSTGDLDSDPNSMRDLEDCINEIFEEFDDVSDKLIEQKNNQILHSGIRAGKSSTMTILDALKSGKPFRRRSWQGMGGVWFDADFLPADLSKEDILATDWYTKE